jgi:hypothetical protein
MVGQLKGAKLLRGIRSLFLTLAYNIVRFMLLALNLYELQVRSRLKILYL